DVLGGGLPRERLYVVQGAPGTGKTTIGLQFLLAGLARGERCLYVTLSESVDELRASSRSHGWSLDGIQMHEVLPPEDPGSEADNTLFHPAEIELSETTGTVLEAIDRINPQRLVVDSLSEIRLLSQSPLRYRRQILALKQFLSGRRCTTLFLDEVSEHETDVHLQTISHGVVRLEQLAPIYGVERRHLRILKLRGVRFRGGFHDFKIETGGVCVFPRLIAAEHQRPPTPGVISSGLKELDALLGGGVDRGTTTLVMGPAGTGKSLVVAQYAAAAAGRGEPVMMLTFDEGLETLFQRTDAMGIPLRRHVESGTIVVRQIDPAQLSPGEFTHILRRAVERDGARVVVIDSLSGYFNAMPEERFLTVQLHELFTFLRQHGVVVLLTLPQHGFVGPNIGAPIEVSYLADTVVVLRYFESGGAVRKAISVLKKRSGRHETTVRELMLDARGLRVGPVLENVRGVLSGSPSFTGDDATLMKDRDAFRVG
ncbi:MAG TPA: ATPase domain-containing protein, partial [Thermoanaerobaculia bacterium]|nr:ATPase domain-containing protein [Thermoanaerobaculia bacterium]